MLKKLKYLFSKKSLPEPEPEPAPVIEVEPEPEPLPEVIEVPWAAAAGHRNFQNTIDKIHDDLKVFFYDAKIKEHNAFKAIEKMENILIKRTEELKKAYKIPENVEYDFIFPEGTGRPGYLKKKK